ncbi:peptidoglycan-recognition protein LB [Manduca sexta]|uniref:Peptidoglycan recognition protein n=1 Tax=Manduca sexta TaxID=7130 RepID=A0A921YX32_MANSE|nr:peptidoglycan-recognition protein LB [Manduca sexta]XP_037292723.1 peptidoglycan-recognition protein LB [Manduca sexta]KAG6446804.1 hypothetical protein O3G_MSEX004616 [Manduca sexta]KAG6446805.1 hypothetical protein O3G_MSEX004616 [Manduca sexta]
MIYALIMCASAIAVVQGFPSLFAGESEDNEVVSYNFPFVTRSGWNARTPKEKTPLNFPVPYVVIHHSYMPPACYNREACCTAMRGMQNFHMDDHGWWDIGYHFAVGSDGVAYEGRGWDTLGAHALHFNTVSIGICLIGDWRYSAPPGNQLKTAKALITAGIELGYIKPDYKLVGHKQVRNTECPGKGLFDTIKTWDHFSEHPSSVDELIYVNELPESTKTMLLNRRNNTTV